MIKYKDNLHKNKTKTIMNKYEEYNKNNNNSTRTQVIVVERDEEWTDR